MRGIFGILNFDGRPALFLDGRAAEDVGAELEQVLA
jgi:hypothetical protein